ncbi:MAG: HD domain-containing protein [Nanoarchaeota archaeon]|nr:HD domain-containing protein [Nanoarchaeota archaeon]
MKPDEIAERLAKEELLDVDNGLFIVHSAAVKYISLMMAENKEDVDSQVLVVASWLHNIGRAKEGGDHAVISCEAAKELFKNTTSDFYYKVCDCVLNHRCGNKPETTEGKILRDADKIAFLHPTYLDFVKAEFERDKNPQKFDAFIKEKIAYRKELILPEGKAIFDEYSSFITDNLL